MNRIFKKLFLSAAVTAAIFSTCSCEKDDTLRYNNVTMGNIVDGRFVSDQGNTFNIVENTCSHELDSMKRALVMCDVLNKTEGKTNEYDVRLTQVANVLTKNIVNQANTNEDMQVQDPIRIEYAWVSGGYINLYIIFPVKLSSKTSHMINLVHEGAMIDPKTEEEISGTYRFSLRHNSFGDKVTTDAAMEYVLAGGYVSFPLNNYIVEKEADFSIEWVLRSATEDGVEAEKGMLHTRYTSDGFQHAPQSLGLQTAAKCKIK